MAESVFGASVTVTGILTDLWLHSAFTDVVGEKVLIDVQFLQRSLYAGFVLELRSDHCSEKPAPRSYKPSNQHS